MTLGLKLIMGCYLAMAAMPQQDNPLYRRWKIVADERLFLKLDGTPDGGFKDRMDSIKHDKVFFEFLPNGNFLSAEGNGKFSLAGDSVHLSIADEKVSFRYTLKDSMLYLYSDMIREDYIRREVLHAKPL